MSRELWALTENGTACAETALCSVCVADHPFPRYPDVEYDSEDPELVTENDAIACTNCGYMPL